MTTLTIDRNVLNLSIIFTNLKYDFSIKYISHNTIVDLYLTRFNKIAIQGTPQMAVDKEAIICYRESTRTILSVTFLSVTFPYFMCTPPQLDTCLFYS